MNQIAGVDRTLDEMLVQFGGMVLRLSSPQVTRTPEERHALACSVNQYSVCAARSGALVQETAALITKDGGKAIAAAVLGDPEKVRWVPLTAQQRFTALQSGEVDVLSRNTTWTLTRDTSLGLNFVGVNYYDGQGFIVHR